MIPQEIYIPVDSQELADELKSICIKYGLPIWDSPIAFIHDYKIEGFWSLLKRGIFGIYHFTSKKHLQMYVDEFVFRYNTRTITSSNRFDLMLSNMENRLTYKELIG